MKYKATVMHGDKLGRKINFPTVNLDPLSIDMNREYGIYASWVWHKGKKYMGALFYGPRLVMGERIAVLEINILDFSKDIYGEIIEFEILDFIREVRPYPSLNELKKQLALDVQEVRKVLSKK